MDGKNLWLMNAKYPKLNSDPVKVRDVNAVISLEADLYVENKHSVGDLYKMGQGGVQELLDALIERMEDNYHNLMVDDYILERSSF